MIITTKTPKKKVLELGKRCDRSNHCCRFSTGFLAEDDLKNIARFLNIPPGQVKEKYLEEVQIFNKKAYRPKRIKKDKAYGRCVFLDGDGCSIHPVKPLQCRVSTCKQYGADIVQWFYVNYLLDTDDPQAVREYANYLKTNEPIPGADLHELVPQERLQQIMNYNDLRRENDNKKQ